MKSCYLASFFPFLLCSSAVAQQNPADACFVSALTLEDLTGCFDEFIVPEAFYDQDSYLEAQPTNEERQFWSAAVTALLHTDNNCTSAIVPTALQAWYSTSSFNDADGQSFCVLYEHSISSSNNQFERGWGYMVVPSSRDAVSLDIHISAPHPQADAQTSGQGTQIFKETAAQSLLVPGRRRTAYQVQSSCVQGTSITTYYMTDPAHNDLEPFFDANVAIWGWQTEHGGCPSVSCAFIQLYGKDETSCSSDAVFLSTGLPNDTWYTDSVDRPVKRLKELLLLSFNSGSSPTTPVTVSLPTDSSCDLVATENVVGRYLNNLPSPTSHEVCTQDSDPDSTPGVFIHAEQAISMRGTDSRAAWIRALQNTFTSTNTS